MAREDGPFEYFDERTGSPGVTANSIRSNLTDPDKNNDSIVAMATTLDQDGKAAANQVEGDIDTAIRNAPDPAKVTAADLGKNGAYALGLMRSFAESVETFDTKVSNCNWQYRTQLASAMRWAGQAAASTEDPEDDKTVTEANMGPGVESQIRQNDYVPAWNKLDGEIEALISDFNNGPSNERVRELIKQGLLPLGVASLYPGLTLTEADKASYYESVLGTMSPDEQKAWIQANMDNLDPAIANVVDPEVQEFFAQQVAADIQDPENIDDDTIALLNMFKGEEAFSTELYETVTPDEMADAIVYLSNTISDQMPTQFSEQNPEDLLARYNGFLNAAGVSLATYSNSPGVNPTELAETWFDAITDDDNKENAAALTLLLREGGEQKDGNYNATFIDTLASDVLEWERDQDDAVWGPRADDAGMIVDPDRVKLDYVQHDDHGYSWMASGGDATDGMANLLGAMGNSPEGAQRFFMNGDGTVDEDRLEYLVTERTFSGLDRSDEGDGLGEALLAATVGGSDSDGDWNRDEGAALASSTFQLIADHSGTGDGFGPDDKWHMWPDMADDMGLIASGFSSDVYDILDGAGVGSDTTGHLTIDADDFKTVLGEIGRGDKTGIEYLSSAIMVEGNNRFDAVIDQWREEHPGVPLTMDALADAGLDNALKGTGTSTGKVLGEILNHSILVDLDDAEIEKTRAAYISKAIDIAGGFLPGASGVLGEGASEFAKNLYDTSTGEGIDFLKNAVEGAPSAEGENYKQASRDTTETALRYNLINQLVRNGYLGEQSPGDSTPNPGIPESLLVEGPNGTRVINPHLYDHDGIDQIGEDGDYTPAQIRQMQDDWHDWRQPESLPYQHATGVVGPALFALDSELNK